MESRVKSLITSKLSSFALISVAAISFISITWNRPAQDDYVFLGDLQIHSYATLLNHYWSTWGGNLASASLALFFLLIANSTNFAFGYSLFGICSIVIMVVAIGSFEKLVAPTEKLLNVRHRLIWILLGFHSLVMPSYWGATGFITAAIAHLWSVCVFIIFFEKIYHGKSRNVLYFIAPGFLAANCNLGEGLAFLLFMTVYLMLLLMKVHLFPSSNPSCAPSIGLTVGVLAGFLLNLFSPGTQVRAGLLGSSTKSFSKIVIGAAISGFDFAFAAFSTLPIFFLCAWLILAKIRNRSLNTLPNFRNNLLKSFIPSLLLIILFLSLSLGSAFSYAAWHQSLGLVFSVFLLACIVISRLFQVGFLSKIFLVSLLLATLVLSLYDSYTGISRGRSWDQNLKLDYCSSLINKDYKFVGAEIRNPISQLGLEDVNRWEWMATPYRAFLSAKYSFECGEQ